MSEENAGEQQELDPNDPRIRAIIDAEVAGLKKANEEISADRKTLRTQFQELSQKLESEEEKRLLKEGNLDEVFSNRTSKLVEGYQKQLSDKDGVYDELNIKYNQALGRVQDLVINNELQRAASETGLVPSAVRDAAFHAKNIFKVQENGDVIAEKDGVPLKDSTGREALNIRGWLEEQRTESPHWFGENTGTGAKGSVPAGGFTLSREQAQDNYLYNKAKEAAAKAGVPFGPDNIV